MALRPAIYCVRRVAFALSQAFGFVTNLMRNSLLHNWAAGCCLKPDELRALNGGYTLGNGLLPNWPNKLLINSRACSAALSSSQATARFAPLRRQRSMDLPGLPIRIWVKMGELASQLDDPVRVIYKYVGLRPQYAVLSDWRGT